MNRASFYSGQKENCQIRITVTLRAPCAPITSACSISAKTELLAKKSIYEQEIAQYKQEEITLTAKAQEAEQRHLLTKEISTNFGNALIFLQIGILLSSLTTLSKIKYYWYIGSISGIIGFSIFITSYYRNLTM